MRRLLTPPARTAHLVFAPLLVLHVRTSTCFARHFSRLLFTPPACTSCSHLLFASLVHIFDRFDRFDHFDRYAHGTRVLAFARFVETPGFY